MIKIYNYVINYKVEKINTECHANLNKKKQLDYVKEKPKQKIKTFDEILNEHINVTKKSK